jgi:hypothetical protein
MQLLDRQVVTGKPLILLLVPVMEGPRQPVFELNCPGRPIDLRDITKGQFKAANARAAAAMARGPIARATRYDSRRSLIEIALEGSCESAFPAALADGLAGAPRSKLAKIKISPNAIGLHWPMLDADLYVPGLIEGAFGSGV